MNRRESRFIEKTPCDLYSPQRSSRDMLRVLAVSSLLIVGFVMPVQAETVSGNVYENDAPCPNMLVTISDGRRGHNVLFRAVTNAQGDFRLEVPKGHYTMRIHPPARMAALYPWLKVDGPVHVEADIYTNTSTLASADKFNVRRLLGTTGIADLTPAARPRATPTPQESPTPTPQPAPSPP